MRNEAHTAIRELFYYQKHRNALALLDCVSTLDAWYHAAPYQSEEQIMVLNWLVPFRNCALIMMMNGADGFFDA